MQTTRYATSALPRRASISVWLHRNEPRLFEYGTEHARGARAHLRLGGGPAQVPQHALQALEIRRRHLEDVAILAGDVVALQHSRMLFQLAHPGLIPDVVGIRVAHRHKRRDRETGARAIHPRVVARDVARFLE